jgi:hypothetical protein
MQCNPSRVYPFIYNSPMDSDSCYCSSIEMQSSIYRDHNIIWNYALLQEESPIPLQVCITQPHPFAGMYV